MSNTTPFEDSSYKWVIDSETAYSTLGPEYKQRKPWNYKTCPYCTMKFKNLGAHIRHIHPGREKP